ncbi:DUF6090 family protein [Muriicola soli]|uniref:Uncharacterized protein n=1 Tax=Muriicola soli TaxID=2507538 RepID=A0A411E8V6_9FLAO|nr:DUF6090 family protein [Muriicola soli]QBA63964.1 hypothetical protein EQY75_05080 [Muriicola soli]
MIKFFRKIRQNLLIENKTGKYFKYAFGEIVLVVIGILIALQINSWNEERIIKNNINLYLGALMQDMKEDIKIIKSGRRYHIFRIHSGIYMLDLYNPEEKLTFLSDNNNLPVWEDPSWRWEGPVPTKYDTNFINTSLVWLFRYQPTYPVKRTIDEFSSLGLFSKMENHALKIQIEKYYNYFDWTHNDSNKEYNTTVLWNKSLVESGIGYMDLANLENPIEVIFSDKSRRAILKNMIDESIYKSSTDEAILTYLSKLINEIEVEIQRN